MTMLSILVPIYQVADYLGAFFAHLNVTQTDAIQVIFLNDASPDHSMTLVENWCQKNPQINTQIIHLENNVGLTKGRQILLDHATSEYIWYIDSDDVIEKGAIDKVLHAIKKHQPDVLLFDYQVFYDKTNKIKYHETLIFKKLQKSIKPFKKISKQPSKKNGQHQLYQLSIRDDKHYFWNKVFKRSVVIDKQVTSRVNFEIPAYEDIAYTPIWLFYCKNYVYLNQSLIKYRIRDSSINQSIGKNQLFAIKAYLQQADFCAQQLGKKHTYYYLQYKASTYYLRLLRQMNQSDDLAQKQAIIQTLTSIYDKSNAQHALLIMAMVKNGLGLKALKLLNDLRRR